MFFFPSILNCVIYCCHTLGIATTLHIARGTQSNQMFPAYQRPPPLLPSCPHATDGKKHIVRIVTGAGKLRYRYECVCSVVWSQIRPCQLLCGQDPCVRIIDTLTCQRQMPTTKKRAYPHETQKNVHAYAHIPNVQQNCEPCEADISTSKARYLPFSTKPDSDYQTLPESQNRCETRHESVTVQSSSSCEPVSKRQKKDLEVYHSSDEDKTGNNNLFAVLQESADRDDVLLTKEPSAGDVHGTEEADLSDKKEQEEDETHTEHINILLSFQHGATSKLDPNDNKNTRGTRDGYRCKLCGMLKKGHICPLSNNRTSALSHLTDERTNSSTTQILEQWNCLDMVSPSSPPELLDRLKQQLHDFLTMSVPPSVEDRCEFYEKWNMRPKSALLLLGKLKQFHSQFQFAHSFVWQAVFPTPPTLEEDADGEGEPPVA